MMRNVFGLVLLWGLLASQVVAQEESETVSYPLSLEQREHLKTYLPRTFYKLEAQRPLHIVALGDSVTWMYTRNEDNGNWLLSYLGVFGSQVARQFFYPGGVRALNPEDGMPEKLKGHLGREIYLENLAIPGRCALDAVQRVTSDAFVNDPDLVVIEYGINDASRSHSLESYRKALQASVNLCRERGVDVILAAPSITKMSPGPTGWGMTRPYATVVREVAELNKVLFVDFGSALAGLGGGIPAGVEPEAGILTMSDRLARIFEFEPLPDSPEVVHPNEEAHKIMGREMFERMMIPGLPEEDFEIRAQGVFEKNDRIEVEVILKNVSDQKREGYLGALAMGRTLQPAEPYHSFSLEAGAATQFSIVYERAFDASSRGGHAATSIGDPSLRLSFFVVDEERSRLMDAVGRLQPISVVWTRQRFEALSKEVQFEWKFVNGLRETARGEYRIGMGDAVSNWVPFTVDPLGVKKFQATFPFSPPPGLARFKEGVFVEVRMGERGFVFPRDLEAVRDVALGQRVALSPYSEFGRRENRHLSAPLELEPGASGVVMKVDADDRFLYFSFDFEDLAFSDLPENDSLVADISIDARPLEQIGKFGFVDKIRVTTGAGDGPAEVSRPQLGAFGNGYDMVLLAEGISAQLTTRRAGARRLEVRVPLAYLYLYDGAVGSQDAVLGFNANLSLAGLDAEGNVTFSPDRRFIHAAAVGGEGQAIYHRDPRGLGLLRLVTTPVATWTAHLY